MWFITAFQSCLPVQHRWFKTYDFAPHSYFDGCGRAERIEKARKLEEHKQIELERLKAVYEAEAAAEAKDKADKLAQREANRQYRFSIICLY